MINQQRFMSCALLMGGLLWAAGNALADEISGTLDGESNQWHVITHEDGSTANFSELMPGMTDVTIQGHREQEFATQGTLSISFMVMDGEASSAMVTYFPESSIMPHYGTEDEVPIELEVLDIDGDAGRAKGHITASLTHVASMSEGHDHSDTMDIDVSFDVALAREE